VGQLLGLGLRVSIHVRVCHEANLVHIEHQTQYFLVLDASEGSRRPPC